VVALGLFLIPAFRSQTARWRAGTFDPGSAAMMVCRQLVAQSDPSVHRAGPFILDGEDARVVRAQRQGRGAFRYRRLSRESARAGEDAR
jgi:hypothetical protein